jgi:hypothetical protein
VHTNLVMVQAPSAEQLEQVLKPVAISNRVIRKLDERTALVSRTGMAAIRKRIIDLGLSEEIARPAHGHE